MRSSNFTIHFRTIKTARQTGPRERFRPRICICHCLFFVLANLWQPRTLVDSSRSRIPVVNRLTRVSYSHAPTPTDKLFAFFLSFKRALHRSKDGKKRSTFGSKTKIRFFSLFLPFVASIFLFLRFKLRIENVSFCFSSCFFKFIVIFINY